MIYDQLLRRDAASQGAADMGSQLRRRGSVRRQRRHRDDLARAQSRARRFGRRRRRSSPAHRSRAEALGHRGICRPGPAFAREFHLAFVRRGRGVAIDSIPGFLLALLALEWLAAGRASIKPVRTRRQECAWGEHDRWLSRGLPRFAAALRRRGSPLRSRHQRKPIRRSRSGF